MNKIEIMKMTNRIIASLLFYQDEDFVDDVINAISFAEPFTEEDFKEVGFQKVKHNKHNEWSDDEDDY